MLLAILSWVLLLWLSQGVFTFWLEINPRMGLAVWAGVMAFSVRPFMVSVPEVTELVTINLLTGELVGYKTGLHFRYPWEQVKVGNYINLRLHPLDREESYPAKDGSMMHAKWQLQYMVVSAVVYITVGKEAIEKILAGVGSSKLSAMIARRDSEECKLEQSKIEEELEGAFDELEDRERLYGIKIPVVALSDLDYEVAVQKVRATQEVARRIKAIAADLRATNPTISEKDAMNAAMILHGDVTKHVNEVEGEGGNALAALLMAAAQRGGNK